jgi:hypothetical protein
VTTKATPSPTLLDAREERARSRWWLWALGAMLLVAAWVASIYFAGRRDDVLAEAKLPDGSILRLEQVTFGQNQKFIVQRPSSALANTFRLFRPEISAAAEFGEMFPQCGVWLTRRDAKTNEPLDLDWLSHCTAIDADGWECTSGFAGRCHWLQTSPTTYAESLFRDQSPFQPLPAAKYREVVVGAFLPLFRPQDGRFPLKVYNTEGQVVATFDAPYPTDPPVQQNWTPVKFPATQTAADLPPAGTAGDLTVTLERIDWTRLPSDSSVPDKRLPTWKLSPVVSFNWQGVPSDDWRFISENIMAVEDGLGNMSYLDRCRLTPHVPAWKLGVLILRKTDGRYESHEQWDSGPIELPPAGEFRDLDLQGQVAGKDGVNNAAHVLKIFGPGKHQFTLVEPAVVGAITPPLAHAGTGWTVSAVHRAGNVDWTVDSQQPFVVWRQPGQPQGRIGLFSRVFDGNDSAQIGVDDVGDYSYGNNTFVTILKSSPTTGAITFKPALSDMRNAYFLISPPPAAIMTGETASEVQSDR